jgi:hypothetical protein
MREMGIPVPKTSLRIRQKQCLSRCFGVVLVVYVDVKSDARGEPTVYKIDV